MIEFDSASAIVDGTVTGRHLLHIESYSHTKWLPVDEHIDSQPFIIGGRTWHIRYYPGGIHIMSVACIGYIAFIVILDDTILEPAHAEARFFLLDRARNEMPAHTQQSTGNRKFLYAGDEPAFFLKRESVEAPECFADNCFKIMLQICVFTGPRCENRGAMASVAVALPDLHQHLGNLLVAKDGADVTFQVAGETFRAHKCVLAARSPVFKVELFGAMKGSSTAAEVCVRIQGVEPRVFSALLHFVYSDSLPLEMAGQGEEEVAMTQHLLKAADRYDMPRLKLTCEDKLCRCLDTHTTATTLVLADQHRCHTLKKACIEFLRCPQIQKAVMASGDFELIRSCPDLLKELMSKVTTP